MKKQYKVSETKGDVQEIAETHTYLSGTSTNFINLLEQRKTLIILIRVVVRDVATGTISSFGFWKPRTQETTVTAPIERQRFIKF